FYILSSCRAYNLQRRNSMNRLLVFALFSLVVAPCVGASAQDQQPDRRLAIKSDVMGQQRVVLVHTPAGYGTNDQPYPVLYRRGRAAREYGVHDRVSGPQWPDAETAVWAKSLVSA